MAEFSTQLRALSMEMKDTAITLEKTAKDLEDGSITREDALARLQQKANFLQFLYRKIRAVVAFHAQEAHK